MSEAEDLVEENKNILNLPNSDNIKYNKNPLFRVCFELRYPIKLEWEKEKPRGLINSFRRRYPTYELRKNLNFGLSNLSSEINHCMISKDKSETVAIRPSSIVYVVTSYKQFAILKTALLELHEKAFPHLDTGFYTRAGLRFINIIPFKKNPTELLNPTILDKNLVDIYGELEVYSQHLSGFLVDGNKYSLRHGINIDNKKEYILDFDYFKENIEENDLEKCLDIWHENSYRFFNFMTNEDFRKGLDE